MLAFFEPAFFETYIKQNTAYVVSETRLDHEDTFAIVDGVLHLSLTRATYERAGLTQNNSKNKQPHKRSAGEQMHRLSFDLRSTESVRGQPKFDRLLWALENTPLAEHKAVAFTVTKADSSVPLELSETAQAVFAKFGNGSALVKSTVQATTTVYDDIAAATVPAFSSPRNDPIVQSALANMQHADSDSTAQAADNYSREAVQEWAMEIEGWLGLVALGSDRLCVDDEIDPYICDYRPPASSLAGVDAATNKEATSVSVTTLRGGIVPPGLVWRIWDHVLQAAARKGWAALSVHGVEDTPVAWGSRPHSYTLGGENNYTAVRLVSAQQQDYGYLLLEITDPASN